MMKTMELSVAFSLILSVLHLPWFIDQTIWKKTRMDFLVWISILISIANMPKIIFTVMMLASISIKKWLCNFIAHNPLHLAQLLQKYYLDLEDQDLPEKSTLVIKIPPHQPQTLIIIWLSVNKQCLLFPMPTTVPQPTCAIQRLIWTPFKPRIFHGLLMVSDLGIFLTSSNTRIFHFILSQLQIWPSKEDFSFYKYATQTYFWLIKRFILFYQRRSSAANQSWIFCPNSVFQISTPAKIIPWYAMFNYFTSSSDE